MVTVTVTGLDGIKRTIPLHLTTSGVIKTDRGNVQFRWIHPQDLQHGVDRLVVSPMATATGQPPKWRFLIQ